MNFGSNKGIYKITCTVTGKFYIGSSVNLKRRKFWHFCQLKNNKHDNFHLQAAYQKYGKEAFIFEVLEFFEEDILTEKVIQIEQTYLDNLQPYNPKIGYNLCKVAGVPASRKGFKHSIKTIELFKTQRKGVAKGDSFKQTMSEMYKGKTMKERTNDPNWSSGKKGKTMKEITNNPNWLDSKVGKRRPQWLVEKLSKDRQGSGNPSFNSEIIILKSVKTGQLASHTRYEWRNLYNFEVTNLLSGKLKTSKGWSLPS